MKKVGRQGCHVLPVKTMGIDSAFEAQKRHEPETNFGVVIDPKVIQDGPERKNCIEVGIVRKYGPIPLAQIDHATNQHHGLFAGGERKRANASLVMVEVIEFFLNFHERPALRCAVEENGSCAVVAGLRGSDDEPTLGTDSNCGCFDAC